ncbi:MAG: MFS transporter [Parasphingorhabdus sp.]|uniref:MFS transporter n=3 Tax=Parasphingorhabdus sp. TaxID=2709688 RepID=UPI00326593ED
MADADPIKTMEEGGMRTWQWLAVAMTVALNALDGFDVLSISFAAPGIAKEWGVDQGILGWVLSMELLGMAIGSILLGGVADKYGRRPTILGCLVAMTIGMWFAGTAGSVNELLVWRLITGLGIGGMLAAINATAAEFSNARWRSVAMALMVIGYPIGGATGGLVVQQILAEGGWRDIFSFGAYATAACIPLVWFLIPETPAFLDRKRPEGALIKINQTFARFGHPAVNGFSEETTEIAKRSLSDIFKPALIATTILITFAYFAHITSFYFIIKWVPKIVVDMGFEARSAALVLTWANVGGAVGGAMFGFVAMRVGLKKLTMMTLVIAAILIVWFGQGTSDLTKLAATVAVVGFFTNAGVVGLYTLFAQVFPTHVRATGTGFAIGVGRGGAVLAPVLAGYLFLAGYGLQTVAIFMASGSLLAAIALYFLTVRNAD